MNGGPEFRAALTEAGFPVARIEAVIRYLGEDKMIPRGGRGRFPKRLLAWEASHYAIAIIALATVQPIDARVAVLTLGEARHTGGEIHEAILDETGAVIRRTVKTDAAGDFSLRAGLTSLIATLAERSPEDRAALRRGSDGLFVRLDFDRGEAFIPWPTERHDLWGTDHYHAPRNRLLPGPARLSWGFEVKLEAEILLIAADLLAETTAKQDSGLLPPEGETPASVEPEGDNTTTNDDAPDPARSRASRGARDSNQPRLSTASGACKAEDREDGIFAQQRNPVSGWVDPHPHQRLPAPCPALMA